MRDVAIKSIVRDLQDKSIDFSKMIALDFFAREGLSAYTVKLVRRN